MEDQSLKRFSRFVRNCLMSLRRDKSGRGDQARDRDRRSPPIKKYSRTDPDSNRRKPHRRAAVSSYDRGIEDSFSSALARYWEEFKLRSAQLSPAGGDSGCRMLSLTALSCFEVGRMAARRSRDTKEYTDPAELRSYPMHLRPLIAWEYIAALFEQNISDVSVFLHLAKACQTAEAHYQVSYLVSAVSFLSRAEALNCEKGL